MEDACLLLLLLGVLLLSAVAALVIQNQRYNALLAAYQKEVNKDKTLGGTVGGLVDTLIKLFV
ncbi:MAG: hypothetical protein IJK84_01900 [Bacteroidales bacterium]|nr:hypothetical protein [Bacteroidales bacterium]